MEKGRKKGYLIVVEGVDGSGKTTQAHRLHQALTRNGSEVVFTEWSSSRLVSKIIKKGKRENLLMPYTFSTLHATDFADRQERLIKPALDSGKMVIADRYFYTALARDVARGLDREWVKNLYAFALPPDAVLYFRVAAELSLSRIVAERQPKFYEAGMDLHLAEDIYASFLQFQAKVIKEYDKMGKSSGFHVIDGSLPVEEQSDLVKKALQGVFPDLFPVEKEPAEKEKAASNV